MGTPDSSASSSLERLAPSIVFQTAAFLHEDEHLATVTRRRETLGEMVAAVESMSNLDLREFLSLSSSMKAATVEQTQRFEASLAAFISLLEHGAVEGALQHIGATDLLDRYRAAREGAILKAKSSRAVLVAGLDNAFGAMRGEMPEERLSRSVAAMKETAPLFLGSFAEHADDPQE